MVFNASFNNISVILWWSVQKIGKAIELKVFGNKYTKWA